MISLTTLSLANGGKSTAKAGFEINSTSLEGKQGVVAAHAHIGPWVNFAAALTGDNHACFYLLSASEFKPQALAGASGVLSGFATLLGF